MLRRTFLKSLPAWSFVFMPWLKPTAAQAAKEIPTKAVATGLSQTEPLRLSDVLKHDPTLEHKARLATSQTCFARCRCCGLMLPFGLFSKLERLTAHWGERDGRICWDGNCPVHGGTRQWDIIYTAARIEPPTLFRDSSQQQLEVLLSGYLGSHFCGVAYQRHHSHYPMMSFMPSRRNIPLTGSGGYLSRWLYSPCFERCYPLDDLHRAAHVQLYLNSSEFWGSIYGVRTELYAIDVMSADHPSKLKHINYSDWIKQHENDQEIGSLSHIWSTRPHYTISCEHYPRWKDAEDFTFASYIAAEAKARSASTATGLAALARLPKTD